MTSQNNLFVKNNIKKKEEAWKDVVIVTGSIPAPPPPRIPLWEIQPNNAMHLGYFVTTRVDYLDTTYYWALGD